MPPPAMDLRGVHGRHSTSIHMWLVGPIAIAMVEGGEYPAARLREV